MNYSWDIKLSKKWKEEEDLNNGEVKETEALITEDGIIEEEEMIEEEMREMTEKTEEDLIIEADLITEITEEILETKETKEIKEIKEDLVKDQMTKMISETDSIWEVKTWEKCNNPMKDLNKDLKDLNTKTSNNNPDMNKSSLNLTHKTELLTLFSSLKLMPTQLTKPHLKLLMKAQEKLLLPIHHYL